MLSGGMTHYDRTIGTILITLVLYVLQIFISRITKYRDALYFLTFLPSLFLLLMLTDVDGSFDETRFSGMTIIPIILFLCCIVYMIFFRKKKSLAASEIDGNLFGMLWKNLFPLSITFIFISLAGNSNKVFHYRLRMESLLSQGEYAKALEVGRNSSSTDSNLTMLRAYALSRTKQLGNSLFEFPIKGKSDALLPNGNDVKCMLLPSGEIFKQLGVRKKGSMGTMEYLLYLEKNGLAMKSVADYVLCGYLLDKNLDRFVDFIRYKYNLSSPSLPKHYKEALTLYTHLRANPVVVFHSEVMDADYADFQKLEQEHNNKILRYSFIKDSYGDTYWFYYFFG